MLLYRFHEELENVELRQAEDTVIAESTSTEGLEILIEAIHAGITRNFTRYTATELNKATTSWFTPYQRPVLVHHNRCSGEPIGRVSSASFGASVYPGVAECITLAATIIDTDAIARVKDSRYMTVSVGGTAEHVVCSICGVDRAKDWCDHWAGREYDGKLCVYDVQNIIFDEISFVNVPADQHAGVVFMSDEEPAAKQPEEAVEPCEVVLEECCDEAKTGDDPKRPKGKDGKPIGKMKTGTRKQAYYGHNLLHGYWRKGNTNWTKAQIIAEHKRVVGTMINKSWQHTMNDGLDETLPASLKKKSTKKNK